MFGLILIAAGILAFSLFSERLARSMLTPPMAFAAFGLVIGPGVLGITSFGLTRETVQIVAEVTLVLVLFTDAARIDVRVLRRDFTLPVRLIGIGLPLSIALGALVAIPLGLTVAEALLLAAVLAPTDAALGQSVVSNPRIPVRIRQTLNVESGLNDGVALPFVLLFAALVAGEQEGSAASFFWFVAKQLALGALIGAAAGWLCGRAIDRAVARRWMTERFEGPAVLATAGLAYWAALAVGGNGFIAAFLAGLLLGATVRRRCRFLIEFAESEGQILALIAFLVFGAIMVPEVAAGMTWPMVLYAGLSLTIVRMLPVALALSGSGLSQKTVGFIGWFGPRGLASILYGLLVVEQLAVPAGTMILTVAVLTVGLSILLHGVTAAPLSRRYARAVSHEGHAPEHLPATEMPTRFGRPRDDASGG